MICDIQCTSTIGLVDLLRHHLVVHRPEAVGWGPSRLLVVEHVERRNVRKDTAREISDILTQLGVGVRRRSVGSVGARGSPVGCRPVWLAEGAIRASQLVPSGAEFLNLRQTYFSWLGTPRNAPSL